MNIIISGWPGAGSTTTSLLMSYLLKYHYVYAGAVMRYIAQHKIGVTDGPKYIEFEASFGPKFDRVWEKYAKWRLPKGNNIVWEGKTAGFFFEDKNIYEIMLIANVERRIDRATGDGGIDPGETLRKRDLEVRQRWFTEFNIDLYNLNQARENYDLVIDNSRLTISETLHNIFEALSVDERFGPLDMRTYDPLFTSLEQTFWEKGKDHFRDVLNGAELLITPQQVLQDWQAVMPEEVSALEIADLVNTV